MHQNCDASVSFCIILKHSCSAFITMSSILLSCSLMRPSCGFSCRPMLSCGTRDFFTSRNDFVDRCESRLAVQKPARKANRISWKCNSLSKGCQTNITITNVFRYVYRAPRISPAPRKATKPIKGLTLVAIHAVES